MCGDDCRLPLQLFGVFELTLCRESKEWRKRNTLGCPFPQIWLEMLKRIAGVGTASFPTHTSALLKSSITENMFSNL